jgi:hypothetical protein
MTLKRQIRGSMPPFNDVAGNLPQCVGATVESRQSGKG